MQNTVAGCQRSIRLSMLAACAYDEIKINNCNNVVLSYVHLVIK